jgi:signal transduction histidine kinase
MAAEPGGAPHEYEAELARLRSVNAKLDAELTRTRIELTEALEQQTATAEVMRIISQSPTDLPTVLDAIAASAARLCEANDASISRVDGDVFERVAAYGPIRRLPTRTGGTFRVSQGSVGGRAVIERRTIHVPDLWADEAADFLDTRARQQHLQRLMPERSAYPVRTALATPLLCEGVPLGVIFIRRAEVRPFTARQISLLESFADQAVIAIENAGLFEELQQKNQELAVASQHKSQFLANMSHELRTPLNAILGYTELLADGLYGDLPGRESDVLERVQVSGRHLLELINDVLDLSKMEAGQLQLILGQYAMRDVVYSVLSAVEPLAVEKGLKLEADIGSNLPIALGDEPRLRQVLLNLVGNALKFTEHGGVKLEARLDEDELRVSVRDSGPGISLEDQGKIFDEFQQAEGATATSKGGTRLGLAIARQIVELHGGRIGVESRLGEGATFWFAVPLTAGSAATR